MGVKSEKKGTSQSSRTPCFCIIISGICQKRHDSANYLLSQVGISAKLPFKKCDLYELNKRVLKVLLKEREGIISKY